MVKHYWTKVKSTILTMGKLGYSVNIFMIKKICWRFVTF